MPDYETINGKRSTHFYSSTPERMQDRQQNVGSSWRLFCGSCAAAHNGACFRKSRGTGIRSTNALRVGVRTRCGRICINISPMIRIWSKSCSTVALCERILAPQVLQKNGGQENQALGRSRGGFSTKIHACVDALGNPLRFLLTGGQRHDITQADDLIAAFNFERVIADRSYDADEFLSRIAENEAEAVIPPRKNRKEQREYDHHLYKERHLIECFFNKIKHYRRLFSRFEKLDQRHLGFLSFAGALIWLR
jgi:transposase